MLKYFFEIETDAQGRSLPITERSKQKLFTGLKISADQDSMVELGKYPVILLSLKNTKGNDYQEIENNIKKKVIALFTEYRYLEQYLVKDNDFLAESQKRELTRYLSGEFGKADLQNSLLFLSE